MLAGTIYVNQETLLGDIASLVVVAREYHLIGWYAEVDAGFALSYSARKCLDDLSEWFMRDKIFPRMRPEKAYCGIIDSEKDSKESASRAIESAVSLMLHDAAISYAVKAAQDETIDDRNKSSMTSIKLWMKKEQLVKDRDYRSHRKQRAELFEENTRLESELADMTENMVVCELALSELQFNFNERTGLGNAEQEEA